MERLKLVYKLRDNYGISYDEAENALKNSGWDILDAVLYLEESGAVKKPDISIFYTGDEGGSCNERNDVIAMDKNKDDNKSENRNNFEGIFEAVCRVIDRGNNIFLRIERKGKFFIKLPLTAVIILLVFTFWIVIPLMVVGLFFDIRFSLYSKQTNVERANEFLDAAAKKADKIKGVIRKGAKHD